MSINYVSVHVVVCADVTSYIHHMTRRSFIHVSSSVYSVCKVLCSPGKCSMLCSLIKCSTIVKCSVYPAVVITLMLIYMYVEGLLQCKKRLLCS